MTPHYADDRVTLHHGSCLDVLRDLPDCSVDAVITDPPYGLANTTPEKITETVIRWANGERDYLPGTKGGFMGNPWDSFVPPAAVWDDCLRVLRPGGHVLAFAGSRTVDLMTLGLRMGGFEIRDSIAWLYGSGFPKSLDVSKAIDKVNGEAGRLHKFTAWMRTTGLTAKQLNELTGTAMGSHYLTAKSQPAIPTPDLWALIRPHVTVVPAWVDELVERIEAEREVVGQATNGSGNGCVIGLGTTGNLQKVHDVTAPATPDAERWQGWGTALKPAFEPIVVARKPLEGTVAANVLTHGTGALNIDACRIAGEPWKAHEATGLVRVKFFTEGETPVIEKSPHDAGRWPANVILDESQAHALDQQSGPLHTQNPETRKSRSKVVGATGFGTGESVEYADAKGTGASRFYYVAKAGKKERPNVEGVAHPTVKPLTLMRWLCRLVTPPGGTILEPFAGSGTTIEAALLEGFNIIGIEREAQYLPLIQARIERALATDPDLFGGAA